MDQIKISMQKINEKENEQILENIISLSENVLFFTHF